MLCEQNLEEADEFYRESIEEEVLKGEIEKEIESMLKFLTPDESEILRAHYIEDETVMDNNVLMVNATFQFEENPLKGSESRRVGATTKIYINGKQVDNKSSTGGLQKITDTQYVSNISYSIDNAVIPKGDMHMKIVFTNITSHNKVLHGKWEFAFDTNREQILADLKHFEMNASFKMIENDKIELLSVDSTPIATVVNFKTNSREYDMGFKLEDDLGNRYEPNSLHISYDQKGDNHKGYERLEPINPKATKLFITPYFALSPKESGKGPNLEDYTLLEEEQYTLDLKK